MSEGVQKETKQNIIVEEKKKFALICFGHAMAWCIRRNISISASQPATNQANQQMKMITTFNERTHFLLKTKAN